MSMRFARRLAVVATAALLPAFGCVTTNQLKDFLRSEVALISTRLLSVPIDDSFESLVGPQFVEEIVPSI